MNPLDRREFLETAGAIAAAELIANPSTVRADQEGTGLIGVGFVGVGSRGTALLENVLTVPGVEVRAICDINHEHSARAQKMVVAAGQPKPQGTPEWKKLLDLGEISAVVSALPCDLHAANYLDVIAAGKDLYGEKPICITPADCDRVVAAANASKQVVQIGFQRRADPRFIESIKLVHEGELGKLVEGRIMWSNSWGPLYDWFGKRERSGDWMVEQAVHGWDVMNWATGSLPVRAVGMGRNDLFRDVQPDRNVHDYYAAMVEYESGVILSIVHSWTVPNKFGEEYTRLVGTKAGIDFNTGMISYRPESKKKDRPAYTGPPAKNNTRMALVAWIDSVRKRSPTVATVEQARDAVMTCLLVRKAVETKSAVTREQLS